MFPPPTLPLPVGDSKQFFPCFSGFTDEVWYEEEAFYNFFLYNAEREVRWLGLVIALLQALGGLTACLTMFLRGIKESYPYFFI